MIKRTNIKKEKRIVGLFWKQRFPGEYYTSQIISAFVIWSILTVLNFIIDGGSFVTELIMYKNFPRKKSPICKDLLNQNISIVSPPQSMSLQLMYYTILVSAEEWGW